MSNSPTTSGDSVEDPGDPESFYLTKIRDERNSSDNENGEQRTDRETITTIKGNENEQAFYNHNTALKYQEYKYVE